MNLPEIRERFGELYHSCAILECPPGWNLILYELSLTLSKLISLSKEQWIPKPYVLEVKQKDGKLCVDMAHSNGKIQNFIVQAQDVSKSTCQKCGIAGFRYKLEGVWHVRCETCFDRMRKLKKNADR